MSKKRTGRAETYISDREEELLEKAADEQDRTRSGYVRHALREQLRRNGYLPKPEPPGSADEPPER